MADKGLKEIAAELEAARAASEGPVEPQTLSPEEAAEEDHSEKPAIWHRYRRLMEDSQKTTLINEDGTERRIEMSDAFGQNLLDFGPNKDGSITWFKTRDGATLISGRRMTNQYTQEQQEFITMKTRADMVKWIPIPFRRKIYEALRQQLTQEGADEIAAISKTHGWKKATVHGKAAEKDRLWFAYAKEGIRVVNYTPSPAAQALYQQWKALHDEDGETQQRPPGIRNGGPTAAVQGHRNGTGIRKGNAAAGAAATPHQAQADYIEQDMMPLFEKLKAEHDGLEPHEEARRVELDAQIEQLSETMELMVKRMQYGEPLSPEEFDALKDAIGGGDFQEAISIANIGQDDLLPPEEQNGANGGKSPDRRKPATGIMRPE